MEPIHRIDHGPVPVRVSRVVKRKRTGDGHAQEFERELDEDHVPRELAEDKPQHEDTPVSRPEEDEVGSHLDLTA